MKLNAYKLRKWSVRVRWRDRKCRVCGSREDLEAHHLNSKSYYPEQAYRLKNGITLCGSNKKDGSICHRTFHIIFMQGFRKKCTVRDWNRFVRMVNYTKGLKEHELL